MGMNGSGSVILPVLKMIPLLSEVGEPQRLVGMSMLSSTRYRSGYNANRYKFAMKHRASHRYDLMRKVQANVVTSWLVENVNITRRR
jgi:hypothetical protein